MPAIVVVAIRYLIISAVQMGLWALIEKYGLPLINKSIEAIMVTFGVPRDVAQSIMGNQVIRAFEEVGIFALTLKSKLSVKVAEALGFTTKGFKIATIFSKAGSAADKIVVSAVSKAPTSAAELAAVTEAVSQKSGWAIKGVGDLLKYVTLFVGTPVGFFYAFAQYVDYAAWQNPYQKTFQGLLSIIGVKPDTALPSSKTISSDTWKRIYATVEQLKPLGISFPFSDKDTIYSRENLAKLVDELAANMVAQNTQPTYKSIMAVLLLQLQFNGKEPAVPSFNETTSSSVSPSVKTSTSSASQQSVKVFTGLVSQGSVGSDYIFTPRPDDLIESVSELQEAINNNVAPYLASLLSDVVYEIKVSASVISDGVRLTGKTQQIQSGTNKDGRPKYKLVTNKFAVADLYLKREGGSRTKLTSIVLGPVNAITFNPTAGDLLTVAAAIPQNVLTSNTDDINEVVSGTPTLTRTPTSAQNSISQPAIGYTFIYDGYKGSVSFNTATVDRLRKEVANGSKTIEVAMRELAARTGQDATVYGVAATGEDAWVNQNPNVVITAFQMAADKIRAILQNGNTLSDESRSAARAEADSRYEVIFDPATSRWSVDDHVTGKTVYYAGRAEAFAAAGQTDPDAGQEDRYEVIFDPATSRWSVDDHVTGKTVYYAGRAEAFAAAGQTDPALMNATTLYEFYGLQGKQMPSLEERGRLYQSLGLGQAAYYTGTAEQNTKLLYKLQGDPL